MIHADEDAYICDMAETYHVFNYRELPIKLLATLSAGLRDNSRIKRKLNKTDELTVILAGILDNLRVLVWLNSSDGQKGSNRPKSILAELLGNNENGEIMSFESAEEFDAYREKILKAR